MREKNWSKLGQERLDCWLLSQMAPTLFGQAYYLILCPDFFGNNMSWTKGFCLQCICSQMLQRSVWVRGWNRSRFGSISWPGRLPLRGWGDMGGTTCNAAPMTLRWLVMTIRMAIRWLTVTGENANKIARWFYLKLQLHTRFPKMNSNPASKQYGRDCILKEDHNKTTARTTQTHPKAQHNHNTAQLKHSRDCVTTEVEKDLKERSPTCDPQCHQQQYDESQIQAGIAKGCSHK